MSITHLIILFALSLPNLLMAPAVKRAGFSRWWVALSCVPVVGFALLWVFAFARWPNFPSR